MIDDRDKAFKDICHAFAMATGNFAAISFGVGLYEGNFAALVVGSIAALCMVIFALAGRLE